VAEVKALVSKWNARPNKDCEVQLKLIQGQDLDKQGLGGLWGVGKSAEHHPALVILSRVPANSDKTLALVGKGIVYDTGGLSLKQTTNMCGMKDDMGGSAGILGAFTAIVEGQVAPRTTVHALLCLAENAIDAKSYRNDDILHMYSGKTVEINNTDAEGRLVLADGVAYASKHLNPDLIIDMATLTGAQMVTTGKLHAGVVCDDDDVEQAIIRAGKQTGDLIFPMLYAPEILKTQFESPVADMKNSVKDRMNSPSSAAGHFIQDHLHAEYKGKFLHIDIAGPGTHKERGTGFGVGLLYQFVKKY
jgi:probable aminopeptidase NPEPL1